jgi:hypothetical protein
VTMPMAGRKRVRMERGRPIADRTVDGGWWKRKEKEITNRLRSKRMNTGPAESRRVVKKTIELPMGCIVNTDWVRENDETRTGGQTLQA